MMSPIARSARTAALFVIVPLMLAPAPLGAVMGAMQAFESDDIGWIILTVPACMVIGYQNMALGLLAALCLTGVWALVATMLGRWFWKASDLGLVGGLKGLLIGLPIVALTSLLPPELLPASKDVHPSATLITWSVEAARFSIAAGAFLAGVVLTKTLRREDREQTAALLQVRPDCLAERESVLGAVHAGETHGAVTPM